MDIEEKALLTPVENEVVKMVMLGLSNKEICAGMNISEATLRRHYRKIYGAWGVKGKIQLVIYAAKKLLEKYN